jgi:hypothetical protein
MNVVTQLVAKRVVDGVPRYSLSCNTDTTLDVLRERRAGRAAFKLVAQVNSDRARAIFQPTSSAPCWTAGRPTFPCLRRRRSPSPIPNTPSA